MLAAEGRPLTAFTAVPRFQLPDMNLGRVLENEWDLAHETALRAGVRDHRPVDAGTSTLAETQRAQLDVHGVPGHAAPNYGWILAALALGRDSGLGVMLTGQQGNATVSQTAEASVWWPSLLRGDLREAWKGLRAAEPDPWLALKRQVLKPFLLPLLQARQRRKIFQGQNPWTAFSAIRHEFAIEMDLEARAREAGFDPTYLRVRGRVNLDLLRLGSNPVGAIWHELGAAFGLEVRDPTAERRLVEFCVRLPDSQLRRRGEDRLLLRRAFRNRLPASVLDNKRYGLQSADLGWHAERERASLQAALEQLRNQPVAVRCLDVPRMEQVLVQLSPGLARDQADAVGCILLRGLNAGIFLGSFDST
jgi:asparagine synthase (glutamine-hydrolysing)